MSLDDNADSRGRSSGPPRTELVVRGRRAVLPRGVAPAAIRIGGGRILAVTDYEDVPAGAAVVDAGDDFLLPGLVDCHVHMNDPGRADWEGVETATRAAAAAGITTLVDMPLNCVPATTSVAALERKRAAIAGRCQVDVGLWGGLVPGSRDELEPLWRAGVLGFKAFLAPSGVPEFEAAAESDLRAAAPLLRVLGAPLLVHAEWPAELRQPSGDPRVYANYLASRPPRAETAAIERLIALSREHGHRVHIVHVATGEALALLRAARAGGLPVSAETCPHYLTFAAEEIADGATAWKCAPPIRVAREREALWQGLADGILEAVVSDHSPSPPALKRLDDGDFFAAWGGIASLEIGPALVWTQASRRGFSVENLARWMSAAPAALAGLAARKGAIAPGRDADLVLFDPDAIWRVEGARLHHRHALTPYEGMALRGVARRAFLRGELVYDNGAFAAPRGELLAR
jgi:allantoinase